MTGEDEFAALRGQLERAVRGVCPVWLRSSLDDIVQVGMLAVMRLKEKETNREFSTSYLRKVAYTSVVDEVRRIGRRGEVSLESVTEGGVPPVVAAGPESELEGRELSIAIRGCLRPMVEPRRNAVTLHLLGYKVPEIAVRMGWRTKQARNLVHRGIKALRECLRERGFAS